jgi:tetratricopeptide (TPR) repeat protein
MPVETLNRTAPRKSKRIQRVVWTVAALCVLLGVTTVTTWRIRKDHQPEEYIPGEQSQDITNTSADRLAKGSTPPAAVARTAVTGRTIDHLLDPGKKLPAGAPQPFFTDVTKEAGLDGYREFRGARTSQLPEDMGAGVAWGDFDNDGLDDLFVVSGGGPMNAPTLQLAPSILYRNVGNGRFEKVEDFPDLRIHGMAAAWGDYNNDGWLDLVVTSYDRIILFRNDHGRLVRDTSFPSPKGFWAGASWGDYNRDGYLDLYVCGYVKYKPEPAKESSTSTQFGMEVPFTLNPASYEPERNLLFRNSGDGTFKEVAKETGVANPDGLSLVAIWHDFDGDGWPDLYVANDISENKLYLNRRGKFIDAGKDAWVEEYRGSMGLAVADFDRDGDDDLFISHWIAQGFALYQNLSEEQRDKSGTSELHFTDVAATSGIGETSMRSVGWGTSFVDIDSDGWPDLLVANGSTFEDKNSTPRRLSPMPSFMFWNAGGQLFHNLTPWNRSFSQQHASRGLAVADFNNDGGMDVAIVDQGEGVRLLRNDIAQGNWVELRLHDRVPPSNTPIGFGDGATVIAWVKGVPLRRTVSSSSYLSQDSHRLHIGLGSANNIDRLEVHWAHGRSETWKNISANQFWDVTQGEAALKPFVPGSASSAVNEARGDGDSKSATVQFWSKQHAAMDAMKRERDFAKAAALFRQALALNPNHEDSHYYLANCYSAQGNIPAAIAELDTLTRINPQNHRALQRKGELMAAFARSRTQLAAARDVLMSALRLNSEETGTLVLLGEVDLGRGDFSSAETTLAHVCQANARAANAWYFRGYVAWKRHDLRKATTMLKAARAALGPDWKPAGSVLEGDVRQRMFSESGFLGLFAQQWDGKSDPSTAYAELDAYVRAIK